MLVCAIPTTLSPTPILSIISRAARSRIAILSGLYGTSSCVCSFCPFNVVIVTLGKEQAVNLGVDYDRCIRRLLLAVTLCISVATAMVGPISFLGLIIANLSRQMLKTYRHTQLILGSALFGMIGLIFGQLIVERIFVYAIPVSVFITVGGGIYFLYLLIAGKRA